MVSIPDTTLPHSRASKLPTEPVRKEGNNSKRVRVTRDKLKAYNAKFSTECGGQMESLNREVM
jgi:hypothetical protein